ncbi:hypothetical protein [Mongoliimonas terrestris]|uniref:hypothetical protein n=1 Tax=Mongoliimonas terrestris TaxID=1709001 RepID=UPI000949A810|nr:hypothetical protein [Mongoliimonas terrestris]
MIARLVLVMAIVLVVLVMCGGRAPAAECAPEAAVEAAMSETAAARDGIRYRLTGRRAVVAAKVISAMLVRPTPAVDTVHAIHDGRRIIAALAHGGWVCAPFLAISRDQWRAVLKTLKVIE